MVGERTHDWTRRARGGRKKMVTQFFMAMRPPTCTAQEKQVRVVHGKPQFYEPQALAAARAKLLVAWLRIWSPSPPAHPLGKTTYTNRRPARKSVPKTRTGTGYSGGPKKKPTFPTPEKGTRTFLSGFSSYTT